MKPITLTKLSKSFGSTEAVHEIDLRVEPGELFFLLGPSGCGKSTLLRMIAGLIEPTTGTIHLGERDVTHLATGKRNTAMVFQSYALWPHMTVRQNVSFGLEVRKLAKAERERQVSEALAQVRMTEYAGRRPSQLSGGQQQRVALARALVVRPDVLLLDEPLSNLDARLRAEMRSEIKRICREQKLTTLYVTHDQEEALSMADRIALMQHGRIAQLGAPDAMYHRPNSRFVAGFLGLTNFIEATVVRVEGDVTELDSPALGRLRAAGTARVGSRVTCSIRPEKVRRLVAGQASDNVVTGAMRDRSYLGRLTEWTYQLAGDIPLVVQTDSDVTTAGGDTARLGFAAEDVVMLDA